MKFRIVAVIITLFTTYVCANETEERAITAVLEKQQQAWNNGDLVGFMQGYWQSEALTFIGRNGIKKGWQTTLDNYQNSYPNRETMGSLLFDILQVDVTGDTAFVLGKWQVTTDTNVNDGFFTLYWQKLNGEWKITIDHSS